MFVVYVSNFVVDVSDQNIMWMSMPSAYCEYNVSDSDTE